MPKIKQLVTQAREDELADRALKARAKLPAPTKYETTHSTEAKARRAAVRLGLPNTMAAALNTTHGWVGVVLIRPDQMWMSATITGHGCRAMIRKEP